MATTGSGKTARGRALLCAVAVVLLALAAQSRIVSKSFGGDWSGLFYTGQAVSLPSILGDEDTARAPDDVGFDGQFYRFIAHDPLILTDAQQAVDNPPLRWRRILIPGAAYALSFGRHGALDVAYFALILLSLGAGVYWTCRYCAAHGLAEYWGAAFVLLPASLISLERMTVDIALCALAVGAAFYLERGPSWKLYAVLTLAPLARETGVALAGARSLVRLAERRVGAAAGYAATVAPLAVWAFYVHARTSSDGTAWFGAMPLGGLVRRTLNPFPYPTDVAWLKIAASFEYIGILGVWAAIGLTAWVLLRRPKGELEIASLLVLALFAFLAKEDIWEQSYGFARTLSPVFLWLALIAVRDRKAVFLAPLALTAPRILFQAATVLGP